METTTKTESEIDYGPLAAFIGTWEGDKGMDVAPEPDGTERSPYYETITFSPIGLTDNAEEQTLAGLYYRQIVRRKSNNKIFHDQTGYLLWDSATQQIINSFTIPRGVAVVAGGIYQPEAGDEVKLEFAASDDSDVWGIAQSDFMKAKARTTAFTASFIASGDTLRYSENTTLDIYGRTFAHTDRNILSRVAD